MQNSDEIEVQIQKEIDRLSTLGATLQPFVIAVEGTSTQSLENFYTYVDGVRYKLPTLLATIDICFKAFQVIIIHN